MEEGPDIYEIEIRLNGERTFYVAYRGKPTDEEYDPETCHVSHGSEDILQEAAFFAWLRENGK